MKKHCKDGTKATEWNKAKRMLCRCAPLIQVIVDRFAELMRCLLGGKSENINHNLIFNSYSLHQ